MLRRIRREELNELAQGFHFTLADEEVEQFHALTEALVPQFDVLAHGDFESSHAVADAERAGYRRPTPDEDPFNAIIHICDVRKSDEGGLLEGKRVALKDNIAVAGVPLTAGSKILDDFVPALDSLVAERILQAGGIIAAKSNMDSLSCSGGGDTSYFGPVRNPFDPTRTTGGSSGGSAAALFYDHIDMALGGDQGGSVRIPSSWSGVIGLKATHGLVPQVGVVGLDNTTDYVGPMGRKVQDVAYLLEAIASKDVLEGAPQDPSGDYRGAVDEPGRVDAAGEFKFGVLVEGFEEENGIDPATAEAVRGGVVERIKKLGANVQEVSIPEHLEMGTVAFMTYVDALANLLRGGNNYDWEGRYWPGFASALHKGLLTHGDELSAQAKVLALLGGYFRERYGGTLYARAQNLRPRLRQAYDGALEEVDFLILPTTPGPAYEIDMSVPIVEIVNRGWAAATNTLQANVTKHPAISLPAAAVDGMPVGAMLIGRHYAEADLLAFAQRYEQEFGWEPEWKGA